ncbi:MAG: hypothetical protein K2Z81_24985 [Cyanobacteria bacterium]|nr:hypothetical protein [Cyanobacteriota bacterium]
MPSHGLRNEEKEAHWRKVFADFERSELSAAKFCHANKIKYGQFMDWRRTIQVRDFQTQQPAPNAQTYVRRRKQIKAQALAAKSKRKVPPAFAQVNVIERESVVAAAEPRPSVFEIVFNDGLVLRMGADCSLDLLSSVVSMLRTL